MTESKLEIDNMGNHHWYSWCVRQFHRVDGPAFDSQSVKAYYIEGKRHRLDGPAREWFSGDAEWWVVGKKLTQEQFDKHPLVIFHRLSKEAL
jgi:hypothetical protein